MFRKKIPGTARKIGLMFTLCLAACGDNGVCAQKIFVVECQQPLFSNGEKQCYLTPTDTNNTICSATPAYAFECIHVMSSSGITTNFLGFRGNTCLIKDFNKDTADNIQWPYPQQHQQSGDGLIVQFEN